MHTFQILGWVNKLTMLNCICSRQVNVLPMMHLHYQLAAGALYTGIVGTVSKLIIKHQIPAFVAIMDG